MVYGNQPPSAASWTEMSYCSGEAMVRTQFEEEKLMLKRQSWAGRQKVIETDAGIRVRRAERLVTVGLRSKREVVNGSRDRPVWW